jgi:hypothetical protein
MSEITRKSSNGKIQKTPTKMVTKIITEIPMWRQKVDFRLNLGSHETDPINTGSVPVTIWNNIPIQSHCKRFFSPYGSIQIPSPDFFTDYFVASSARGSAAKHPYSPTHTLLVNVFGCVDSIDVKQSPGDSGDESGAVCDSRLSPDDLGDASFIVTASTVTQFVGYSHLVDPETITGGVCVGEYGCFAAEPRADDATK